MKSIIKPVIIAISAYVCAAHAATDATLTFKGTVKAPTCSIPASALNFQMGSVTEKSFGSAVGPVSGVAGQTINLIVTCDASVQSKNKNGGFASERNAYCICPQHGYRFGERFRDRL